MEKISNKSDVPLIQKSANHIEKFMKKIPKEVDKIIDAVNNRGFKAYAVGGCVRDVILGREPKDWDVTTDATPDKILEIFPDSVYENDFGTVGVKTASDDIKLAVIEVTTFRAEAGYTDKRHPDEVKFVKDLKEDLARRDFTINALALSVQEGKNQKSKIKNSDQNSKVDEYELVDLFGGKSDIEQGIIRAVGNPDERFGEDALRMMRAVRFSCQLGFKIEPKTLEAIKKNADLIKLIAQERIKDELFKIIISDTPKQGMEILRETGILHHIIPELADGIGVDQNKHHVFTIYEHAVNSLEAAGDKKFALPIRLAALFHDIAKPQTKRGQGPDATFYNHDIVGAKIATRVLDRLHAPREIVEQVAHLIRHHMFYYNVDEVSESGVRRLLTRVGGVKNFQNLLDLRVSDRLGSGVPKAIPYKLRHLQYLVDKVSQDPISVGMLKVRGDDVMRILSIPPSRKIGLVLNALLAEVLEDPKLNTKEYLEEKIAKLAKKNDEELRAAFEVIEEKKEEVDLETKKRHYVK